MVILSPSLRCLFLIAVADMLTLARTTIIIALLMALMLAIRPSRAHAQRETCPAIGFVCGPSGSPVAVGTPTGPAGQFRGPLPANINPRTGRPYDEGGYFAPRKSGKAR